MLNSLAGLLGSAEAAPLIAHFLLALLSKGTALADRENVVREVASQSLTIDTVFVDERLQRVSSRF